MQGHPVPGKVVETMSFKKGILSNPEFKLK